MKTTCVMLFLCICSILLLFTSAASRQNKWKAGSFKKSNKDCKPPPNVQKAIKYLRKPTKPAVCRKDKSTYVRSMRTPRHTIIRPCYYPFPHCHMVSTVIGSDGEVVIQEQMLECCKNCLGKTYLVVATSDSELDPCPNALREWTKCMNDCYKILCDDDPCEMPEGDEKFRRGRCTKTKCYPVF